MHYGIQNLNPRLAAIQHKIADHFSIEKFANPAAVTLTMKLRVNGQNIDPMIASREFRYFKKRLDAKLLGSRAKRYGKRLNCFAVVEANAEGRLHYHAIIDRPSHCEFEDFKAAIAEQWSKVSFGYRHIKVKNEPNEGWNNYLVKLRQKSDLLDAIDWANCHLAAE